MTLIGEGHAKVLALVVERWNTDPKVAYLWAVLDEGRGSGIIVSNNITISHAKCTAKSLQLLVEAVQGERAPIHVTEYGGVAEIADQLRGEG